jgi:hypothetical protein
MLYEEKVKTDRAAFLAKVQAVCLDLDIEPDWLMAVMNSESGLNPAAVNPNGGATGLIQFMPATAAHLGTSTTALAAMTATAQMDYVRKYLYPYRYKIRSYADLYMAIFFPAMLGQSESRVISSGSLTPQKVAAANRIFDLDANGVLTVSEVREAFLRRVPEPYRSRFRTEVKKK